MENKPAGAALGSSTSTTRTLAHACGYASDYHATTHPSLPNYLALTSGSTHGVTDDGSPAQHPIAGPSIFSEVAASGRQWATYAEAMPGSCVRTSSGTYATKHNPALYYTGLGGSCSSQDVPLGSPATGRLATALHDGSLPAFVLVVPDLCDDTHDCPVSLGDRWLRRWVDAITSSPTYAAGRTAVFVTWDEDDRSHGNVVALLVLAPAVRPGTVVASPTSHLTLLRTAEDLLGLSGSLVPVQPSMRAAFGL
jgi:phospholipase C